MRYQQRCRASACWRCGGLHSGVVSVLVCFGAQMAARGGAFKGIKISFLPQRRPLSAGPGLGGLGAQMAVWAFLCVLGPCVPAQQGARSGGMAQQGRGEVLTRMTWHAFSKVLSLVFLVLNTLWR